jgi:hypothetical protein
MSAGSFTPIGVPNPFYRCSGPNCGILKELGNHWWLMWTSGVEYGVPVLYLAPWNEELAQREGTLHVCGEGCAQKLQSQFLANIRESLMRRLAEEAAVRERG